ncbi:MAG: metallopeptidase family protein [Alphaproteobacteria bacterium]
MGIFRSSKGRHAAARGPVTRERFTAIVAEEMDALPEAIHRHLENVAVVVEDDPDPETLEDLGLDPEEDSLYGFYDGTPITERGDSFGFALPDRIVIYYRPLTEDFGDEYHLRREIRKTVVHEVGHFFGLTDREIERMGY